MWLPNYSFSESYYKTTILIEVPEPADLLPRPRAISFRDTFSQTFPGLTVFVMSGHLYIWYLYLQCFQIQHFLIFNFHKIHFITLLVLLQLSFSHPLRSRSSFWVLVFTIIKYYSFSLPKTVNSYTNVVFEENTIYVKTPFISLYTKFKVHCHKKQHLHLKKEVYSGVFFFPSFFAVTSFQSDKIYLFQRTPITV